MRLVSRALRAGWIFFWAGVATIILFIPVMAAALLSRTGNLPFTMSKWWAYLMLAVSFVRVRVTGREKIRKDTSYVIIANHQSQYDILALVTGLKIQFRWVIKQEILKVPLFGYALYASRNIFIDRRDTDKAKESIRKGLHRLPPGTSIMFFAEGTRSPDGTLRPFKKGGFMVALERGIPILPVTVNGSRKVLPKGAFAFTPGTIDVVISDPIPSSSYSRETMDELMAKTWQAVHANLVL